MSRRPQFSPEVKVPERLYPKKRYEKAPHVERPWGVRYDLVYDNGLFSWNDYYRTRWGAKIAAWWKYHFASWGGSAVLFDNRGHIS
jgi:hypothetical protein